MKIDITYSRTIQLQQYEPLTISATIKDVESGDIEKTVAMYSQKLENAVDRQILEKYNLENSIKTDQDTGIDF